MQISDLTLTSLEGGKMDSLKLFPVEKIYNLMLDVFIGLGVPAEEAKICSDVLIESDLRGIESHGIGRLKMYFDRIRDKIQNAETKIGIISNRKATAVWDGNHGMGQVIGFKAMQAAITKAEEFGLGSVAVRNSTHYGIAGYYAKMATDRNMIGLTFTNARPSIAPLFGVTPLLGTNPICFGAPSDLEYPFLYDAATSITQRGKIEVLDREHKQTPEGWAIDDKGLAHTDTRKLLIDLVTQKASLLALGGAEELLGGHKGYGLSTMVEILCAALQNGSYLDDLIGLENGRKAPYKLGHFFLVLNIEFFTDPNDFRKIVTNIMQRLKNSEIAPGKEKIYIAGEKEYLNEQQVRKHGIPINQNLLKDINTMIEVLNLEKHCF